MMPREAIKPDGSCEFSKIRKAELIRTRESFQKVTRRSGSEKGQLDHMNSFGGTNESKSCKED